MKAVEFVFGSALTANCDSYGAVFGMYIYVIGILNKLHYIFLLLLSGCLLSGPPRKLLYLLEQKNNYALSQLFSYEGNTRRVC